MSYKTENSFKALEAQGFKHQMIIHLMAKWILTALEDSKFEKANFYASEIENNVLTTG